MLIPQLAGGRMTKVFDFEDRCGVFARDLYGFLGKLPKTGPNPKLFDQLYRSAASIGANYVEACDSLGKKEKVMKLRISRREASETRFHLGLLVCPDSLKPQLGHLKQEVFEVRSILSAMIRKQIE